MQAIKKMKAFTIAELLVVLVLTSIVISIALVVLNLVQKQILGIQSQMNRQTQIQVLEKVLWHDFNKYELNYLPKKRGLICANPIETVYYSFENNYVLRNLDTIKVSVANKHFYLDGEIINRGVFDAVEIEFSSKFQNRLLFVFKKNDAAYYINNSNTK